MLILAIFTDMKNDRKKFLLNRSNYKILIISVVIIFFGYVLMSGGKSEDPNEFNPEIFNFQRIRFAPTVIIFGFILVIYSILHNEKNGKNNSNYPWNNTRFD